MEKTPVRPPATPSLQADDARGSSNALDEIAGVLSCPEVRQVNYATTAHLRLGDPAAAPHTAEDAIRTLGSHSYGTTPQMHITLARAHVQLGEADGAAESLVPVLDIVSDHRLAPVTRRMLDLAAELGRTRVGGTVGADPQMKIHTWCRDSAALPPGPARKRSSTTRSRCPGGPQPCRS